MVKYCRSRKKFPYIFLNSSELFMYLERKVRLCHSSQEIETRADGKSCNSIRGRKGLYALDTHNLFNGLYKNIFTDSTLYS